MLVEVSIHPLTAKAKNLVPMQPRKKKVGGWKRAMLRFLEGGHEEIVAAGFSLRSLAQIFLPSALVGYRDFYSSTLGFEECFDLHDSG